MTTKISILEILEKNRNQIISGEDIATELNVSRTSVWKAVKDLQAEGYSIEAGTNKGYMLTNSKDVIFVEGIKTFLKNKRSASKISVFKTLESTNQTAKKITIDGVANGTVIIANEQTSGRGRRGRKFYSPADSGIYMSIILRPEMTAQNATLITTAAAVAVCRAIEAATGIFAGIKWVNDIFVEGKKVCGILTESVTDMESGSMEYVIVGIGINFSTKTANFPKDIKNTAGSLFKNKKEIPVMRNRLAAEIINEMTALTKNIFDKKIIEEYRKHSIVISKKIDVIQGDKIRHAKAINIDDAGGLVVKYDSGKVETLTTGEISIRVKV